VFERFTEPARQVVVLAQDEARALSHNYIGTEHILLGLLREQEGLAARVLVSLDVTLDGVRDQVARIVGQGDELLTGQIPFTPRAKKVLELSLREALALGHNYIGTEHLLLGLISEGEGVALRILLDLGADGETVRTSVVDALSGAPAPTPYEPQSPPISQEVVEELRRLEKEKGTAFDENRFDDAASLRDRERRLLHAARELERAWRNEPPPPPKPRLELRGRRAQPPPVRSRRMPRRISSYDPEPVRPGPTPALVIGWALFGLSLGIGILIGWAIWG